MSNPNYEAHLAELVERYIDQPRSSDASIVPVLVALGGRHVSYEVSGWCFMDTSQPSQIFESCIRMTLLRTLRSHLADGRLNFVNGVAVMDVLLQKERWREAVADEVARYDMAELLMHFSEVFYGRLAIKSDVDDLKNAIEPALLTMLNDWLIPDKPITTYPPLAEITRLMFGDAWVSLVLDAHSECDAWDLSLLMSEMRPRFAPGLIPGQVESMAEALPSLDAEAPC